MSLYGHSTHYAYSALPAYLRATSTHPFHPNFPNMPSFSRMSPSTHLQDEIIWRNHQIISALLDQNRAGSSSFFYKVPPRDHHRSFNPQTYIPPVIYSPPHFPQAERLLKEIKSYPLLPDAKPLPKAWEIKLNLGLAKVTRKINRSSRNDPKFRALEDKKIEAWENARDESKQHKTIKKGVRKGRMSSLALAAQERKVRHHYRQAQVNGKAALNRQIAHDPSIFEYFPRTTNIMIQYLEKERTKDEAFLTPRVASGPKRVRVRKRNGRERRRVR